MQIDTGMAAILVTILITLVGMGVAWGTLRERVKNNTKNIDKDHTINREDHQLIFTKLDAIQAAIKSNGVRKKA